MLKKYHIEHDLLNEEYNLSVLNIINSAIKNSEYHISEIYPEDNEYGIISTYSFCKSYAIIGFEENYPKVENAKELNQKIIKLAYRNMLYVKKRISVDDYDDGCFDRPEINYKYNTNTMRRAINTIVPFLFCKNPEYQLEYDPLLDDYDEIVGNDSNQSKKKWYSFDEIMSEIEREGAIHWNHIEQKRGRNQHDDWLPFLM